MTSTATDDVASLTPAQQTILDAARNERGLPGVAAAVVHDGVVRAGASGQRDRARGLPMTPRTVGPICSLTKSLTASAVMRLVEAGQLWLDEPIVSYLPEFKLADPVATAKITPRLLLCHKSGLGRVGYQRQLFDPATPPPFRDRAALVAQLAAATPQTPPNASYAYCNEGYLTLSVLVERISGQDYASFLDEQVLTPLGMTDSAPSFPAWRAAPDQMVPYTKAGDDDTPAYLPDDYALYLASGGVTSTVLDLARYAQATLDPSRHPFLSAGALDQMQTISNPFGDTGRGYGFGWSIAWDRGRKVVAHGGGLPGVNTYLLLVPAARLAVAVMMNLGDAHPEELAQALAGDALGAPLFRARPTDPYPIATRYPAPATAALIPYVGRYRHDTEPASIEVSLAGQTLSAGSEAHGRERMPSTPLVAIGPDTFMSTGNGELLQFIRDARGPSGVLAGGDLLHHLRPFPFDD